MLIKKLKKEEVLGKYTDKGICIIKWGDKRDVIIISFQFSADLNSEKTKRSDKIITKPEGILRYDDFMGGIDRIEQLMAYYSC